MMYFKFYSVRIKCIIIEKYFTFYYKFAGSHLGKNRAPQKTCADKTVYTKKVALLDRPC